MNSTLTSSFLIGLALGLPAPGRYLAATLHLPPAQAAAVQLAVGKYHWRARTPEHLAQCLVQVLTPSEFNQFLQLQDNAAAHNNLRCLALR